MFELTLTIETLLSLTIAMVFMALLPSVSVATVLARSATLGFKHGVMTTLGIVLADVFFIILVIAGLVLIAEMFNQVFIAISYLGGAYLIWLSLRMRIMRPQNPNKTAVKQAQLRASFNVGFLLTLADQKAVLFYLAFFPAFLNLTRLTYLDILTIIGLAIVSVGTPKLIYAYLADRAGTILKPSNQLKINRFTALLLFVIGLYLIIKTTVNL
jgi:threonine/homoserine/homoserine lactone efflux protein